MARGRAVNKNCFKEVPKNISLYNDVLAVSAACPSNRKCKACHRVIEKGTKIWYAVGENMKSGEDTFWHDKCL